VDIEFLKFLRDKTGQGFDFTRQIPNIAFSALTRVPFLGTALGIGSMFQQTPEQENFMKNIYSDEEYQNLLSQIPGAENLNPVYMLGSGRGLSGALSRRLGTINRALGRMTPQELAQTSLEKRKAKIEQLLQLEKQKEAEFQQQRAREIQQQNKQNRRGGYQYGTQGGGGGAGRDFMSGSGRARDMGSFKDGGLTSLLFRRK